MTSHASRIWFGGKAEIRAKQVDSMLIGGPLVLFNDPELLDAYGTVFSSETDYMLVDSLNLRVLYRHGLDGELQTEVIGLGTLRQDDEAVWIEAQLDLRKKFVQGIANMAEDGDLGWSSGTAEHLYRV